MSIGLYDIDFMNYVHVPFNLNLMKLATYYKRKKEVVVLAPVLEPERYQRMFVVKDYVDEEFDKRILAENVTYSGHAFTKEYYSPMEEEIERVKPDKYLYHKYDSVFCINKAKQTLFNTMTNAEHIRLSLDGATVWNGYKRTYSVTPKTCAVIFHDYDLGRIKDSYLVVKDIINQLNPNYKQGQLVGTKFPIQVYTQEDFEKWLQFNPMDIFYTIQFNGIMEDEFLNEKLIQSRDSMKKIYYNVTPTSSDQNHFITIDLPKIFRQALLSRTLRVPFLLKYTDGFFKDERWKRIIKLINHYIHCDKYRGILRPGFRDFSKDFTLFRYITSTNFYSLKEKDWFTKEELRDLFQLVREKNYETFKMFYESCLVECKGGKIIDIT